MRREFRKSLLGNGSYIQAKLLFIFLCNAVMLRCATASLDQFSSKRTNLHFYFTSHISYYTFLFPYQLTMIWNRIIKLSWAHSSRHSA